jgi:hypothetical protein
VALKRSHDKFAKMMTEIFKLVWTKKNSSMQTTNKNKLFHNPWYENWGPSIIIFSYISCMLCNY